MEPTPQTQRITLRQLAETPADLAALQRVLDAAPLYFTRVTGAPASAAEAHDTLTDLPPGCSAADKVVLGIELGGELVGCIDVIRGYPAEETAMLGLLLVGESWQGAGVGAEALAALESVLHDWPECRRIRMGVVRTNADVLGFWHQMGFAETGDVRPFLAGSVQSDVIVLEKPLPHTPSPER